MKVLPWIDLEVLKTLEEGLSSLKNGLYIHNLSGTFCSYCNQKFNILIKKEHDCKRVEDLKKAVEFLQEQINLHENNIFK